MPWNPFRSRSSRGSSVHSTTPPTSLRGGPPSDIALPLSHSSSSKDSRSGSQNWRRSSKQATLLRDQNALPSRHGQQPTSRGVQSASSVGGGNNSTLPRLNPTIRGTKGGVDPESNPLSGSSMGPPRAPGRVQSFAASLRSTRSTRSIRSARSNRSGRSIRSGRSASARSNLAQPMKAAHAAKVAALAYIAAAGGKPLFCYTCGQEFSEVRCSTCGTVYVPPGFEFSPAPSDHMMLPQAGTPSILSSGASISSVNVSGSGASVSAFYVGFYPSKDEALKEGEESDHASGAASLVCVDDAELEDHRHEGNRIDLELIDDLVACDEYGLLEAVVFDAFSTVDTVINTFSPDFEDVAQAAAAAANAASVSSESKHVIADGIAEGLPLIIDIAAVQKFYSALASVSSAVPMRGVLQGAQVVLQRRRHVPIDEKELAYICVVLQCPAIYNCSMFTMLTGPLQKLSRYAGLRSRARNVLEISAGLLVHTNAKLQELATAIFTALPQEEVGKMVQLCNSYVSHRLSFDFHSKSGSTSQPTRFQLIRHDWYADDWRMSVVVRFMSLLWAANSRHDPTEAVPEYSFYNSMVDMVDLRSDYDSWQTSHHRKRPRLCVCRYPFLLSMGSKSKVLEYHIAREVNSAIQREMFALFANPNQSQSLEAQQAQLAALRSLDLRVKRSNLLEDSVRQLCKWRESKRRALRVEFVGEPGIDAGGLKKEWFLLFFRQIFDPVLGAFQVDDTSTYSWFALGSNSSLDYYRAAGTALGLALANGITVDLNLPLLIFKVLLDRPYTLEDVGTLWPELAQSLQSVLEYADPDFEDAFGFTFTAPDGTPLLAGGEDMNVTLASRELYVDLLVDYLVNSEGPQIQVFKSAFLEVCGGNAMTLFQPTELELLVRGDRKPIDIEALRSVTKYVHFGHRYERANKEPVVQWFWDYFAKLEPAGQARLLQFITATDRAPAAGMIQMRFSIMCLGSDSERLPIAHTCFNQLCLYRYKTRSKLEKKLSLAMAEHQGFGLK